MPFGLISCTPYVTRNRCPGLTDLVGPPWARGLCGGAPVVEEALVLLQHRHQVVSMDSVQIVRWILLEVKCAD